MTRPEALVRQLTNAVIIPLQSEQCDIQRRSFAPPPVTAKVRALWPRYRRASREADRLRKRLDAAGAHHYSGNGKPRMKDTGAGRNAALATVHRKLIAAKRLRDAAMLAVLGLDAAKARPIVLKLKADLERLAK